MIDPAHLPRRLLTTAAEIPAVGLRTFGSDRFSPARVADAVRDAASVG